MILCSTEDVDSVEDASGGAERCSGKSAQVITRSPRHRLGLLHDLVKKSTETLTMIVNKCENECHY